MSNQILIIDDEVDFGEYVAEVAKGINFTCTATADPSAFIAMLNEGVELVIVDLVMPNIDGVEMLRHLKKENCKSKILLMSGFNKKVLEVATDLAKELNLAVVGHVQKPIRKAELEKILNEVMGQGKGEAKPAPVKVQSKIEITKELIQEGLDRDQILAYYQPQVNLATNKLVGLEVLARWQHPEHGLILPDSFISIAENTGMIDQIGWRIAEKALKEISEFFEYDSQSPTISLNVSPYTLLDLKFPDTLLALAHKYNIRPAKIMVEVTESGLFKDLSSALDILARLRLKNMNLSIDDFGTGYAMMQQLKHVPANELKIDKSFVQEMSEKESGKIMVLKIIEMGHALDMQVLAEGVETQDQVEFLRANKCDIGQGYYFSRPIPFAALMDWINSNKMGFKS